MQDDQPTDESETETETERTSGGEIDPASDHLQGAQRTDRIRELNDALRTELRGNGQILVTQGIQSMGEAALMEIMGKVQSFDQFGPDNDPYGEHDFGSFEYQSQTIYWKVDQYDLTLTGGSPDPADPAVTRRVLTILLASEY